MKGVEETESLQKQKNKENRATQKRRRTKQRNEQRKEQINEHSEKRGEESDRVQKEMEHTDFMFSDSEVSNRNVSWADDHFQLAITLLPSTASPLELLL